MGKQVFSDMREFERFFIFIFWLGVPSYVFPDCVAQSI